MKQLLLTSFATVATVLSASAFEADLDGTTFNIDTVYCHVVGPGVTQSHLTLSAPGRNIKVYTSTLRRSEGATAGLVEPRVIIGKDQCRTAESLSSMAARHDASGEYRYLTGINGDFFITSSFASQHEFGTSILGYPNMACAIDGKIAAPDMIDIVSRENALITTSDSWYIDATDFKYRLLNNDGSTVVDATAVNYPRRSGEMVVYNSYMGASTATDATGREMVLRMADGASWSINKSVKFVVDTDWTQGGNTSIPADGIVISCGPGYSNEYIDGLKKGDVVKLKIVVSLPAHDGIKPDIVNILGGDVRILNKGNITREAIRWINTPGSKYQRSVVGFSEDRDMMVFVAVDGSGLTYYESAALLKALGCYDGLDLDGGGSTAVWSKNFGIYNSPRDGSERAIGNGLYFALKAPADNQVASIRFADHAITLPLYGSYTPVIYGYNRYGQLVDTNITDFTLTAGDDLGTVDGTTLLCTGRGMHALKATCGDMTASIAVTVDDSFPASLKYSSLIVDNIHPTPILLTATVNGTSMPVDARAFAWESSDDNIATVDQAGIIKGVSDGVAVITGRRGDNEFKIDVTVQSPVAAAISLLPDEDASAWKNTATGSVINGFAISPEKSVSLDFTLKTGASRKITLKRAIALHSIPDAIEVAVKPGEAPLNAITINLTPAGSRQMSVKKQLSEADGGVLTFHMSDFADVNDPGIYPLTFQSIVLEFGSVQGDFHIDMPSLNVIYKDFDGVQSITAAPLSLNPAIIGGHVVLPFIASSLELYDTTGRLVTCVKEASSVEVPNTGVYILVATTPAQRSTAKIVVR